MIKFQIQALHPFASNQTHFLITYHLSPHDSPGSTTDSFWHPEAVNSLSSPSYFEGSQFRRNLNLSLQDTRGNGLNMVEYGWINQSELSYTTSRAQYPHVQVNRTSAWMRMRWITTSQGRLEKPQLRSHSRCCWVAHFREIIGSCGWLHDEPGTNAGVLSWVELGQLFRCFSGATAWGFIRLWLLHPWALARNTTAGWRSCPRLAQQIILMALAIVVASIPKAVVTTATTASTATMTTRSESARARRRALKGWEWLKWMPVPWAPCLILHMGPWDHWCHPLDWHLIPCHLLLSLCLKHIWHLQDLQVFHPSRGMSLAWHLHRTIFRWTLPVLSPCPLHLHGRIMWVAWRKRIVTFVVCWCNAWVLLPPSLPAWFPVIAFMPWKAYSQRHQQGYQVRNMPIESIRQRCHLVPFLFVHRGGMPRVISRLDIARFWVFR